MIATLLRWVFRWVVSALLVRVLARFFPRLGAILKIFHRR
jgi:hypothetical protein